MMGQQIEIIDTHCHATDGFMAIDSAAPAPGTFDKLFDGCRHTARLVVATSGRNPVLVQQGNVAAVRKLAELIGGFGEKFIGSVMVNPHDRDGAMEAIELGINELGFKAVGELVQYIHNWVTDGPQILPIVQKAIQLDVPMNFHSSTDQHAEGVAHLAEKFPRGRFIIAHAGGGRSWRRGLEYVRKLPNVWVEVMDNAQPGELEGVLAAVGAARMTYGTDFSVHTSPKLRYWPGNNLLDRLEKLQLPDGDVERICCLNARQLLRVEGP